MLLVKTASATARHELKRATTSALQLSSICLLSPRALHSSSIAHSAPPRALLKPHSRLMQTATSSPLPTPPPPSSAPSVSHSSDEPSVALTRDAVCITWSSGVTSRFHHVWLRDHCRCPACYHQKTKQRLLNTFEVSCAVNVTCSERSS